jgi:hypothetical protein
VGAYQTSPIKRRRHRATKAEVEARREALLAIVDDGRPMTVRQVFYQATVRGLVEKAESGYAKVQNDLTLLRRAGELPYDWLADNTRWQRKPRTFDSVEDALNETAKFYRKNLWSDADAYVEIWLEKDALAGVVYPITSMYDVPLMVARGYASLSFLYTAADYINGLDVPVYIYHLGDFDPSGVNAGEKIEETLREMAPDAEITFKRLAVIPRQITQCRCQRARRKARIPAQKILAISASSLMRSNPIGCGGSCGAPSNNICHRDNSRCSRLPRQASARSSPSWSWGWPHDRRPRASSKPPAFRNVRVRVQRPELSRQHLTFCGWQPRGNFHLQH